MAEEIDKVGELVDRIATKESRARTRLVGIDGCGGAGKSTLAQQLVNRMTDARAIGVDDFWLTKAIRPERARVIEEPGCDYDWQRLRDQVLVPLMGDRPGRYQRYDWESDALHEWHDVAVGGTVIVEGVFVTRQELASYYDLRVWVDVDEGECLARGIERDGGQHRELWEGEWMPAYRTYIDQDDPVARADFVLKYGN